MTSSVAETTAASPAPEALPDLVHQPPWDLLVIGGGTAGIVGAKTAARFGARVLLVDHGHPGGDCLFTGCVPSKSLLAAAAAAADARDAARLGVDVASVEVDFGRVMAHVHGAIEHIAPTDSAAALERAGVRVLRGHAELCGPGTASVDGVEIVFRQALLAAGAGPARPPIPGLAEAPALTSETVWGLRELPRRLAVLGGGSIGCELSQAFARLGSDVTVVEAAPTLLAREDPDAAAVVTAALEHDGVTVRTGSGVTAVTAVRGHDPAGGAGGRLTLEGGDTIEYDVLLVAVGRSPRTDALGLESAGVQVDERGYVVVDEHLRTTNRRVWAAGDLTGHPQFTHLAGVHASTAVTNAVLGLRRAVTAGVVPRVTFTHPEVAAVGASTGEPETGHTVRSWSNDEVDRAVAEGDTSGFTKLVTDRRGRLVGATVVGPRAGETLAELTLAVTRGLTTTALAGSTHPYPTFGDGPWNAAVADVQQRLGRPVASGAIHLLAATRRWVVNRRP